MTIQGDASITGVELPLGSTALVAGPGNWSVDMAVPMPCNALTKLAVFSLAATAPNNLLLFLGSPAAGWDLEHGTSFVARTVRVPRWDQRDGASMMPIHKPCLRGTMPDACPVKDETDNVTEALAMRQSFAQLRD